MFYSFWSEFVYNICACVNVLDSTGEAPGQTPNLQPIGRAPGSGNSKQEYHILRLAATLHIVINGLSLVIEGLPMPEPLEVFVDMMIPLQILTVAHRELYSTLAGQKSTLMEVSQTNISTSLPTIP